MADDWSIEESAVVVGPEVQDIKLFGKWSADEVQVGDISLTVSIYLKSSKSSTHYLNDTIRFGVSCKGPSSH